MNEMINAELVHHRQQDQLTAAAEYRQGRLAWAAKPARRREWAPAGAGEVSRRGTARSGASVLAGRL